MAAVWIANPTDEEVEAVAKAIWGGDGPTWEYVKANYPKIANNVLGMAQLLFTVRWQEKGDKVRLVTKWTNKE